MIPGRIGSSTRHVQANTRSLGRDLGPFVFVAEGYGFHLLWLSRRLLNPLAVSFVTGASPSPDRRSAALIIHFFARAFSTAASFPPDQLRCWHLEDCPLGRAETGSEGKWA
jgi:hypothetical protein